MDPLDVRAPDTGLDAARLLAAVPEAVVVLRGDRIAYANEAAAAMAGEDPFGRAIHDLIPDWREVPEDGHPFEASLHRAGDEPLPLQIRVARTEDTRGPLTTAVLRDARELVAAREAEVARLEAEARYRALVEEIPAVIYADEGGEQTTYVSPQIEEILGVTPAQYRADPDLWMRMVHPDDRASVKAQSDAFLAGRGGDLDDYRMIRPDGRVVWIRDRAFAVRDEHGHVLWEHGILFDVSELKEAEARIAHMAFHDTLTGLANRALFEETLGHSLERAKRAGLCVAVLFLDLDNFKDVNDTQGHHAGDTLLTHLAERLRRCTRDADLVARQGGDEFLILLGDLEPHEAVDDATHVATRIQQSLRNPFSIQGVHVEGRGSIGISLFPRDAADATTLLQHADVAMYEAKRTARGEHAFWDGG
jgi:diguanylate cyclase (GGDEF)-like protein/PAS domain S-box-containing protein